MSFLGGLFGGGSTTTTVSNNAQITVSPNIQNTIINDDSRLQGLVDAIVQNGNQQIQVTALQAEATLEAAQAQQKTAEATSSALTAGLTRAAIIGAVATLAVNFGPKLLPKLVR